MFFPLDSLRLITDRFADGDPRNNELFASGFDVRDMTYRHGGDFIGVCLAGDRKCLWKMGTSPENIGIWPFAMGLGLNH